MTRELDDSTYKTIISVLKDEPLRWSGLIEATNIPEKSLDRALKRLVNWGLIKQDENGYWNWFEGWRSYETEHAYTAALNHSRSLLESFQGMFTLETAIQADLTNVDFHGRKAIENEMLRDMVAEHVKTGYPKLQAKINAFNDLRTERDFLLDEVRKIAISFKIEKTEKHDSTNDVLYNLTRIKLEAKKWVIPKEFRNDVEKLFERIPENTRAHIIEVEDRKSKLVVEIARDIQSIVFQVKNSDDPLRGFCSGCPKTNVKTETGQKSNDPRPEEVLVSLTNMRNSYKAKGYPDTEVSLLNDAIENVKELLGKKDERQNT